MKTFALIAGLLLGHFAKSEEKERQTEKYLMNSVGKSAMLNVAKNFANTVSLLDHYKNSPEKLSVFFPTKADREFYLKTLKDNSITSFPSFAIKASGISYQIGDLSIVLDYSFFLNGKVYINDELKFVPVFNKELSVHFQEIQSLFRQTEKKTSFINWLISDVYAMKDNREDYNRIIAGIIMATSSALGNFSTLRLKGMYTGRGLVPTSEWEKALTYSKIEMMIGNMTSMFIFIQGFDKVCHKIKDEPASIPDVKKMAFYRIADYFAFMMDDKRQKSLEKNPIILSSYASFDNEEDWYDAQDTFTLIDRNPFYYSEAFSKTTEVVKEYFNTDGTPEFSDGDFCSNYFQTLMKKTLKLTFENNTKNQESKDYRVSDLGVAERMERLGIGQKSDWFRKVIPIMCESFKSMASCFEELSSDTKAVDARREALKVGDPNEDMSNDEIDINFRDYLKNRPK